MIQTHTIYIEIKLTEFQIFERRLRLEQELDEQDKLTGEVASKKLEIKSTTNKIEAVTARVRQLRKDIRNGFIVEAREAQLTIPGVDETADTLMDRPDPETDPKPPPHTDRFETLYPPARTHGALRDYLHDVLTDEQYVLLVHGTVEGWPVGATEFDQAAHWARVEKCCKDAEQRAHDGEPGIPGLYIPGRMPMPKALSEWLVSAAQVPKKKRQKRVPKGSPANG